MTVVGLGLVMADVVVRSAALPNLESDPKVESVELRLGGSTANVLTVLRWLGRPAALVSVVGDDWLGNFLLDRLAQVDVDATGVRRRSGPSASCVVIETPVGRTLMWHWPDHFDAALRLDSAAAAALVADATAVHVNGRFPMAAVGLCRAARAMNVPVSVNAGRGDVGQDVSLLVDQADVLVAADEWAIGWTEAAGCPDAAAEACRRLAARPGPALVCVTAGPAGSWAAGRGDQPVHVPAAPLAAGGTAGMGDAYHAGVLDAFLAGADPAEAAFHGATQAVRRQEARIGARA